MERFSYGKMISVTVHNLLYQPMDENIKTWTFRFPAKKKPSNTEKAFLDMLANRVAV